MMRAGLYLPFFRMDVKDYGTREQVNQRTICQLR